MLSGGTDNADPHRPQRAPQGVGYGLKLLLALLLALAGAALASPTVLVHQFESQDVILGAALAAETADSLDDRAVVIGPEVASASVPPLVVEGGFINPGRILQPGVMYRPAGADLLRGASDVDVAVTGYVEQRDDRLSLFVSLATRDGMRTRELTAAPDRPLQLALLAGAFVGAYLDEIDPEGAPHYARPVDAPTLTGGFDTPNGSYARAVALASAGLQADALAALESAAGEEGVPTRAQEFLDDLRAVSEGEAAPAEDATSAARRAYLSVQTTTSDVGTSRAAFGAMYEATGLTSAAAWEAALAASVNDRAGADEAYERASEYDYGAVAAYSFRGSRGAEQDPAVLDALLEADDTSSAALLAAAVAFDVSGGDDRQEKALLALHRASPFLPYPLEALSYIYFDRDDARAAAQVLAVAVELEPESDLYWTNLGWSWYLLGDLERSEEASVRALSLAGMQTVAAYNLGLVRTVTGRLDEALSAYEQALRFDPEVNDEAVEDLQNARSLYPQAVEVDFALARLLEADGRRQDARDAYRRFVRRAGDPLAEFVTEAQARLVELEKPLPPMEVVGDVRLTLGQRGPESGPYHPGDPVHPTFELSTQGDSLPTRVDVTAELRREGSDGEPIQTVDETVQVPDGAVGFVVDLVRLALPADLEPGTYTVAVTATGGEEQQATGAATFEVTGGPDPLRQLVGRGLVMTGLRSGQPLYTATDLDRSVDLVDLLLAELDSSADAAEEALPAIEGGRFAGMTGGELFRDSTAEDVSDFLDYILASDSQAARFAFVDAYAQWALDGAPAAPAAP